LYISAEEELTRNWRIIPVYGPGQALFPLCIVARYCMIRLTGAPDDECDGPAVLLTAPKKGWVREFLRCSFCGFVDTRVLDSRPVEDGYSIRRRRECSACGKRFTTYEKMDELPLVVVKKDGRREPFDRHKLLQGLLKACQKRPVSVSRLEEMAGEIERELKSTANREVRSQLIGEAVITQLKDVDEVAYVRFASVYREFRDAESFVREIGRLLKNREQGD